MDFILLKAINIFLHIYCLCIENFLLNKTTDIEILYTPLLRVEL